MLPRCASRVNVQPMRLCILSESAPPESAPPESALPESAPLESAPPESVSVPIMYRQYLCTILYFGISALSISAVMGIFRNGAILHVACTIGQVRGYEVRKPQYILFVDADRQWIESEQSANIPGNLKLWSKYTRRGEYTRHTINFFLAAVKIFLPTVTVATVILAFNTYHGHIRIRVLLQIRTL